MAFFFMICGVLHGVLIALTVVLDYYLFRHRLKTIREHVRANQAWLGVAIVLWLATGVVGVTGNFFFHWFR